MAPEDRDKAPRPRARQLLRSAGLRATRGRTAVLDALLGAGRPLSHCDVEEQLQNTRPDRVSIYRALASLVEAGLVHRAYTHNRTEYYELPDRCGRHACHPHFTCLECGRVTCLDQVDVRSAARLPDGYRLRRQKVMLEGVCPACAGG